MAGIAIPNDDRQPTDSAKLRHGWIMEMPAAGSMSSISMRRQRAGTQLNPQNRVSLLCACACQLGPERSAITSHYSTEDTLATRAGGVEPVCVFGLY